MAGRKVELPPKPQIRWQLVCVQDPSTSYLLQGPEWWQKSPNNQLYVGTPRQGRDLRGDCSPPIHRPFRILWAAFFLSETNITRFSSRDG